MGLGSRDYLENVHYAMALVMWAPNALHAMAVDMVFWASAKPATAPAWFSDYLLMKMPSRNIRITAINLLVSKNRSHNFFAKFVSK